MSELEALRLWVRDEQERLWSELENALRQAVNRVWSIDASATACRIISAARLTWPTPYDCVPWSLLAGGVYEALLRVAGIEPQLPTDSEWLALDAVMSQSLPTRAELAEAYRQTLAAIGRDSDVKAAIVEYA